MTSKWVLEHHMSEPNSTTTFVVSEREWDHDPIAELEAKCGWQSRITAHHDEQLGDKPLINRVLKLCEEAGEVAGAEIRHSELRDGRGWRPEIIKECGDVYVVLLGVLDKIGVEADDVFADACRKFLDRTWNIGLKESTNG